MKITIIYDNTAWDHRLAADWGFSCLVEAHGCRILFDTGAQGAILAENMKKLGISADLIDTVFISHDHWDHTGGLPNLLKKRHLPVYVPDSYQHAERFGFIRIREPQSIGDQVFTTGELGGIEQSLAVRIEDDQLAVIAGCSHPGVDLILQSASRYGTVSTLIGGLHGFCDLPLVSALKYICPTHCTQYIREIAKTHPEKYISGGAGKTIEF